VQELDNSLEEKYNDLKESAKNMALMVKTMLAEDGFRIHYPKGAEILLKYLHNLNEKINAVEDDKDESL
jgi:hypothetical protein